MRFPKRARIAPLAYWAGERQVYSRRAEGAAGAVRARGARSNSCAGAHVDVIPVVAVVSRAADVATVVARATDDAAASDDPVRGPRAAVVLPLLMRACADSAPQARAPKGSEGSHRWRGEEARPAAA